MSVMRVLVRAFRSYAANFILIAWPGKTKCETLNSRTYQSPEACSAGPTVSIRIQLAPESDEM